MLCWCLWRLFGLEVEPDPAFPLPGILYILTVQTTNTWLYVYINGSEMSDVVLYYLIYRTSVFHSWCWLILAIMHDYLISLKCLVIHVVSDGNNPYHDLIQLMIGRSGAEKMHGHACIFVSCTLWTSRPQAASIFSFSRKSLLAIYCLEKRI